jgi:hypothetical protein
MWFLAGGILFIILFVQTLSGHYGKEADVAWAWFLPTVLPTLSVIVGVVVSESFGKAGKDGTIGRFPLRVTVALSILYLLAVTAVFLWDQANQLPLMKVANLGLGPLQGLVAAAIGAFFSRTSSVA